MKIKVTQNQSIWDVALQYTGSTDNIVPILLASNKVNFALFINEELIIPDQLISKRVSAFYITHDISIGTSATPLDEQQWNPPPIPPSQQVDIYVNNTLFRHLLAPIQINIPVVNTESTQVLITFNNNDIVLSDIELNVTINNVLQGSFMLPVGKDETININ